MPTLDLGYHGALEGLAATAGAVDQLGDGGLFVSEAAHDPFVPLASVAALTSTVDLGTAVAIAFARTPMSLAYAAHDLQRLTGGRLRLGLGTQIAPHVVKRFAMPWSRPAARMKEYVAALHAIWDCWETGDKLSFRGDFYEHTLMPDAFSPGPLGLPRPPIWLAAVGPQLLRVAAEVADGLLIHPMTSAGYLEDVLLPTVDTARHSAGRTDNPFTRSAMALVATGRTAEELAASVTLTRRQIAFYASTPAYLPVLAHHGWEDLHTEASAGMRRGDYATLGDLVDDEVLEAFAVVGDPSEVATALGERYRDIERLIVTMAYQDVGVGSAAMDVLTSVSTAT